MSARYDEIVSWFDRQSDGLDAVENGLRHTIIDGLSRMGGQDYSWEFARKAYGIYTVNGRVKGRERFRRKLKDARCGNKKPLTFENFTDFIPDMVGVRVICLHLGDLLPLATRIREFMAAPGYFEAPPAQSGFHMCRVRTGGLSALDSAPFKEVGFHVDDPHQAGYSSIHFVSRLGPTFDTIVGAGQRRDDYMKLCKSLDGKRCLVEVQLRTLLEEAWGEVDHAIRYEDKRLSLDADLTAQMAALASYLQAGNHHISIIREVAKRKVGSFHDRRPQKRHDTIRLS